MTKKTIITALGLLVLAVWLHWTQYDWGVFTANPDIRLYTVTEAVPEEVEAEYYGLDAVGGQTHRGYVLGLFLPVCLLGGAFWMVGVTGGGHRPLRLTSIGYGATAVVAAAVGAVLVMRV